LVILIFGVSLLSNGLASVAQNTTHSSIFILGDVGFTRANGVSSGSGTAQDPFVIDGVVIDNPNANNGIRLQNTRAHAIIRNCTVRNTKGDGIVLQRVFNVTVENCHLDGNENGVDVVDSFNLTFRNNTAEFNRVSGFSVFNSRAIVFEENAAFYNWQASLESPRSWGFSVDLPSKVTGRVNRASGHVFDIWVSQGTKEDESNLFNVSEFVPETSCTQIFNQFFLFVGRSEDAPPLNEPLCAALLAILRSLPDAMRGRINQFLFLPADEEIAGAFTGVGTVRLFDIRNIKTYMSTVFHEIGHVLQDRLFTAQDQKLWEALHERSGTDSDHYPIQDADGTTRINQGLLHYAMINQYEDFASTFESYTRDTQAMVQRARRIESESEKTLLLEKIAFVASLFQGQPFAYRLLLDWDSVAGQMALRLQRAAVRLEDGAPAIDDTLDWEEF